MKPLKREMWEGRDGLCDYCGEWMYPSDLQCHLHHGLVYNSDLPRSKQKGIDEPSNRLLVHASPCHEALQSDRQWAWEFKAAQYGEEAVQAYIRHMRPKTASFPPALPDEITPLIPMEGEVISTRRE